MFKFLLLLFLLILPTKLSSEINNEYYDNNYFHIGKMNSYNSEFILYFKTRKKAILAKGEFSNYINDFPQDSYKYKSCGCLLYTSPSPRDGLLSRMPSSA